MMMQWMKRDKTNVGYQFVEADKFEQPELNHSRMAGMIQVCRPDWSARKACQAARVLSDKGVERYHGVREISDYLVYLETQLARHITLQGLENQAVSVCEGEVKGWAEYWQDCWDVVRRERP